MKALLVVSFGTSYKETREKTIFAVEKDLAAAFPDRKFYRAWSSGFIIRKLAKTEGLQIDTLTEALDRALADGVTDLLVQPTHFTPAIENDKMMETLRSYRSRFDRIAIGAPLLASDADIDRVITAVRSLFSFIGKNDAIVFMGHGTEHSAGSIYRTIDDRFQALGCPNFCMGTVEGDPSFDDVLGHVKALAPAKVWLSVFMFVAGDHATNDMAGDEEDSWKNRFNAEGFETEAILRGFGEYPEIRAIYIEHAKEAAVL